VTLVRFFLLGIITILSGCSMTPQQPDQPLLNQDSWDTHQQRQLALENWRMNGKIGIRTSRESHSANIHWQQLSEHYTIELTGPLGQGGAKIEGNGNGISIDQAGEEPVWAPSPELLMDRTLGWQFPVRELLFWVRGIPAPNTPFSQTLVDNRLSSLSQNNWQIKYLRYQRQNQHSLPGKLTISQNDLRITIVAKEWQILP